MKTYKARYICENCQSSGEADIKKGILIKEAKCPNCNCKSISLTSQAQSALITHKNQESLLRVINQVDLTGMTLRKIGEFINSANPQQVKHHLDQLENKGLIFWDRKEKILKPTELGKIEW